jgi:Tfp pilus assembly protein PilN
MRPLVNLSSQPFRNRRLFWLAILLLFVVPSYFGLQAIETMTLRESEIAMRDAEIKRLQSELKKIEKPVSANVSISTDQNRQLVAASELVARRAFSWSSLLNDIERNLPAGVRVLRVAVTQIQPSERDGDIGGDETAATLGMTVIGKSNGDVTTMINKFHESGRFKVFPLSKKAIEGTEDVEFELKVEYFPPAPPSRASLSNQIAEKK